MYKTIVSFIFLVIPFGINAQNVTYDISFGNSGIVTTQNTEQIRDTALCTDGKIVSTGYASNASNGFTRTIVAKYNTNGSLDTTFGNNGLMTPAIPGESMGSNILVQNDDKIIVYGSYYTSTSPSSARQYILRYDASGILDPTFGNNGIYLIDNIPEFYISQILILPDNKLLAGANLNGFGTLCRFTPEGNFDTTFGTNGMVTCSETGFKFRISFMILLEDSTLLCCGVELSNFNSPKSAVAKLNLDGTFFTGFGTNGKIIFDAYPSTLSYEYANKLIERPDNKIVVFGYSSDSVGGYILKLNANGTFDTSFGTNGKLWHTYPNRDYAIQSDGKILIAGSKEMSFSEDGFTISRLNPNGSFDSTFNNNSSLDLNISTGDDSMECLTLQPDGKVILSGSSYLVSPRDFALVRLTISDNLATQQNDFTEDNVSILPNPFVDEITIQSKFEISKIEIHDINGRLLSNLNAETDTYRLNLASDTYICTITSAEGKVFHKKLIRN